MPRLTAPRRQAEVCAPLPAAHAAARYARHLPERTLLYALVQAHYPDFIARLEAQDRPLPEDVREQYERQHKELQEAYGEAMLELRARKKLASLLGKDES